MRARLPDESGDVVRHGVRLAYDVYGAGATTVLLLPPWAIVDSRIWKFQIPFLARRFRVVTYDPRGNGRSDRPHDPAAHADAELVADAVAVLDATGTRRAVVVGLSMAGRIVLQVAADHPDRVAGAVMLAPTVRITESATPSCWVQPFEAELPTSDGWAKYNAHHWRRDLPDFARWFFGGLYPEPHSTKAVDDAVEWARNAEVESLIAIERAARLRGLRASAAVAARVRCPSLVVQGTEDVIVDVSAAEGLAAALNARLEIFQGAGHCVQSRHPVRFNLLIREFVEAVA